MPTIAAAPLESYVAAIFADSGCEPVEAAAIARRLVAANLAGHDSHGVVRVPDYTERLRAGNVTPNARVQIVSEGPAFAVLDGGSGFGQVIGAEAMAIGMGKARAQGVALVALRRTHHLGRIGDWAETCADQGFASVHFVNAIDFGPIVAPFGGRDRRVSTNPFCCGMPAADGRHQILDFATSRIAEGKVIVARNRGGPVPEGAIIDADGRPSVEPEDLYQGGALLPFGEHKGYGLSFFCEILAGAVTGGGCQHEGRADVGKLHNNMLSFVIDLDKVGNTTAILGEVERHVGWMKASRPLTPGGEIMVPGDPERRMREKRRRDGLPLDPETWRQLRAVGDRAGLAQPT